MHCSKIPENCLNQTLAGKRRLFGCFSDANEDAMSLPNFVEGPAFLLPFLFKNEEMRCSILAVLA